MEGNKIEKETETNSGPVSRKEKRWKETLISLKRNLLLYSIDVTILEKVYKHNPKILQSLIQKDLLFMSDKNLSDPYWDYNFSDYTRRARNKETFLTIGFNPVHRAIRYFYFMYSSNDLAIISVVNMGFRTSNKNSNSLTFENQNEINECMKLIHNAFDNSQNEIIFIDL